MNTKNDQARILVIDDELGPRESLRFLFKDEYNIECADSVDAGVKALVRTPPDVIIMDIRMPEKTGIQGLREIRDIDASVSIIMLTGFGSLETAQEAIRHGANDYVKKPFDTTEMRDIVRSYVDKTHVARAKFQAVAELQNINQNLQSELTDKEHLAQLGQASSEFVHDIRNPLTVICGYVQLLMQQLQESDGSSKELQAETAREYLARVERSVFRCQEMANMWSSLGKHDDFRMEPCNVADVIKEVAEGASTIADEANGSLELDPCLKDCLVRGDSLQLFRAIQNLVSNAIQAFPDKGGVVTLGWDCSDDKVSVTVKDNGAGIPDDKVDSIFNPYVTTKDCSGGMGIGLFITKKVIDNHSGSISISNAPTGGAVACVELPRLDAATLE